MKMLYVSSGRLPTEKAQGYQVMKMCEAFARKNDIVLVYPGRRNRKELRKVDDIFAYYALESQFALKKLFCLDLGILHRLKLYSFWFGLHSLTYALSVMLWVLHHRKEFEVVYSRAPLPLYLITWARKYLPLRFVYESHTFPQSKNSYRVRLAMRVDRLVVVTQKIKDLYVQAGVGEDKIIVEPDAVDIKQFDTSITREKAREKLNIPPDIKIAAFVGKFHTMDMEKGIPEVIASARYLIDEFPDLFFYFVGGPLDREKIYRKIIQENELPQERFVFREKQPVKEVPLWLKASDILLMPHPKNTFYSYYVSPLKMFEYMAAQRPVVGSRLPAIQEILIHEENALLGEPGDPESIANNIRRLLKDPESGKRMVKNAFSRVQDFTWEKRTERILE